MLKRLLLLLGCLTLALPAAAQLPGQNLLVIAQTPIQNGTSGDCLTVGSNNLLAQTASCGSAAGLTPGTSIITGGTASGILWNNAGVLATGPALTDSSGNISAPTAASLNINADALITRRGAANLNLGAADAAAPVAQILSVQSVVAGTSNVAGADFTLQASRGTGTGVGGRLLFQVATATTTGSTQNALSNAFIISSTGSVSIGGTNSAGTALRITGLGTTTNPTLLVTDNGGNGNISVLDNGSNILGRSAPATNATVGFVYVPVTAGQPTGTPTTQAGYVPFQYDSTNHQFWIFEGGAWKQPKTPAGAATVTWQ